MLNVAECIKDDEETTLLKTLAEGALFRFASVEFNAALNDSLFYVVAREPMKDERRKIVNPSTGEILVRDASHSVIVHKAHLAIER